LVHTALLRMRYGLLHVAFEAWRKLWRQAIPSMSKLAHRLVELEAIVQAERDKPPPPPPPEPEPLPPPESDIHTFDLAPVVEAFSAMGGVMGKVLAAMGGITQAVGEGELVRQLEQGHMLPFRPLSITDRDGALGADCAVSGGGLSGGGSIGMGGGGGGGVGGGMGGGVALSEARSEAARSHDAAEWVRERLRLLELKLSGEVEAAAAELKAAQRTLAEAVQSVRTTPLGKQSLEVVLHPIPFGAVDAAAAATFAEQLRAIQAQLAHVSNELNDVHTAKAYR
jgi:hypothetical protein